MFTSILFSGIVFTPAIFGLCVAMFGSDKKHA